MQEMDDIDEVHQVDLSGRGFLTVGHVHGSGHGHVPVQDGDDIDEVHQLDPVHQVDHKDELAGHGHGYDHGLLLAGHGNVHGHSRGLVHGQPKVGLPTFAILLGLIL